MMKKTTIPVAAEGWPFILPLAVVASLLFVFGWNFAGFVALLLSLFVLFFFRDPERIVPEGTGVVVSPADGKVVVVKDVSEPVYLKQEVKQISIFLSVFDVHVNRSPMKGIVELVKYNPGKFHIASLDKASHENEQTAMVIVDRKQKILVKQIAGIIARRIVCYAGPGDMVRRGERYGLIRFGSRVDLFLSRDAEIRVRVGERVKGGQDIIGVLKY
jgi:phosphatidylserine decarboxylase